MNEFGPFVLLVQAESGHADKRMECTGRGLALGYGARALTMAWEAAMLAFTRRSVEEILVTDPYTGYQIGVAPIDYGMTSVVSH